MAYLCSPRQPQRMASVWNAYFSISDITDSITKFFDMLTGDWRRIEFTLIDIFVSHATTIFKLVERDHKRKCALPAKWQRKKCHQASADSSLSSRRSYSRYDGGPDATDVPQDIPPHHLQDLIISFYKTKVVITPEQARQLKLLSMKHNHDKMASGVWKA